ncbi:MAG: hypothetical protein GTO13_14160 [Proteobacteria bacterium]|nr:hypothetical protein [Pseudomonadota bacterium]
MGGRKRLRAIAWIFLSLCLSSGCTKYALRVEKLVRSVAVIPFFIGVPSGEGEKFIGDPISGRSFVGGEIAPNARRDLTDLIYRKLSDFPQLEIVPLNEVNKAMQREDFERDPMGSALRMGRAFGVDGVVVGRGFRYEERIGGAFSVKRPASVSFVIHLVGVKEGSILWSGLFQETQQPLSEDIRRFGSFLRRGGVWLKAKGLASVGMDELLVSFPASREMPEGERE